MFTHVDIKFRFLSWFTMVLRLGLDSQLTLNESMIRVTVRTVETPRNTDTVQVNPSCQNEINLVPIVGLG